MTQPAFPTLPALLCTSFPLIDAILEPFSRTLGTDLPAYRNHIYRVLNYFAAVSNTGVAVPQAVLIAAAFHDLGIWTDQTFDYLAPSVQLARHYLVSNELEGLEVEVQAIITEHHKLRAYKATHAATVEAFRKADLIDVSLGVVCFGLPSSFIQSVRSAFPNAGFHWRLVGLTARQFLRSPFRPLPMMHW